MLFIHTPINQLGMQSLPLITTNQKCLNMSLSLDPRLTLLVLLALCAAASSQEFEATVDGEHARIWLACGSTFLVP